MMHFSKTISMFTFLYIVLTITKIHPQVWVLEKKKKGCWVQAVLFPLPVIGGSPLEEQHKGSTGSKTLSVSASGI